jgi:hypothetical protein
MLHLKILNDECLLEETLKLVRRERELLTDILHHLREIERRRLYGTYSSLFGYVVGALGYSEDQAVRRIAAMRLLKDLPQIEDQLQSGQINLSHVGLAHSLFKSEVKNGTPLDVEAKLKVFSAIAGRPARESQKILQTFASVEPPVREVITPLGGGRNLVTPEMSDDTLAKIQKLKGLMAHKTPDLSTSRLVDQAFDLALDQMSPARPSSRKTNPLALAQIRREIWRRDGGACVRCKSVHAVEEDHVLPKSMGGPYTLENIRLLCRPCNQRAAIEKLGLNKMDRHLSPATSRVI